MRLRHHIWPTLAILSAIGLLDACHRTTETPGEGPAGADSSAFLDDSGQLYNATFDDWCRIDKVWYAYAADTTEGCRIWGSGNNGTITLGENNVTPEREFLAVTGDGKAAAKLETRFVGLLGRGKLAAGSLFTGRYLRTVGTSGAELSWGLPYSHRPRSLQGYCCYRSKPIDRSDKAHNYLKGQPDTATLQVVLADWDTPFIVRSDKGVKIDPEGDPAIIGHAMLEIAQTGDGYVAFDLAIDYRSDRQPRYLVIAASSSKYGDYFTGGTGATLWIDEFRLCY